MPSLTEDFDLFWHVYPLRIAKIAAHKAFEKARKQASQAEILDGVLRYIQHKPDWQAYAHPASWLRAGRWLDEYEEPKQPTTASDWWAECQALHGGTCSKRWDHDMKRLAR